jgi:hypothetical protein
VLFPLINSKKKQAPNKKVSLIEKELPLKAKEQVKVAEQE